MLALQNISFAYDDKRVISDIDFTVPQGQHLAIIGESGCGKSTLLKLIYGLYDLDQGEIHYDGKPVLGPKFNLIPGMDSMKYLAQDFDLMPFTSVEENIGKYLSNVDKDKKTARTNELLDLVEMTAFAKTHARYLSGGQQQRVALARVLALEPKVLLLDEPFSQIDVFRRNNLRRKLFGYLKEKQITCIFTTHDSTDILAFADETVVMKDGKLRLKGNPKAIYQNPTDFYTASLFGEINEIPKHLVGHENEKGQTILCYPHQLSVVPKSGFEVKVVHPFFKGDGFLVEAIYKNQKIFFNHSEFIAPETAVLLSFTTK